MSKIPSFVEEEDMFDIALIDGDILTYQYGNMSIKHPFLNTEMPAKESVVRDHVDRWVKTLLEDTMAKDLEMYLTGFGNFRMDVSKQQVYKGNRTGTQKPFHWKTVRDHLTHTYGAIIADDCEADDLLGIRQEELMKEGKRSIICSRDKDLKICPGWHFEFSCAGRPSSKFEVSEFEGIKFFMYQMLIGDSTDNIPGCSYRRKMIWGKKGDTRKKGIGSKTAEKLLKGCSTYQELYDVVKSEYSKLFQPWEVEDIMLENARLLYIGQRSDNLFDWSWLEVEV